MYKFFVVKGAINYLFCNIPGDAISVRRGEGEERANRMLRVICRFQDLW